MLNLTPKQFFEKLDYSKLDENTAQEIRSFVNSEEFKYLELSNELDEFKKVVELVAENFPEALGLKTKEQIAKEEEKKAKTALDAEQKVITPILEAEQKRILEEALEEEQEAKDAERVARITSKLKVLDDATKQSVEATAETKKLVEKVENLTNRLELVKEMSADEPKNKGFKERIELISEMLSEAKEELESDKKKYSVGGTLLIGAVGAFLGALGVEKYREYRDGTNVTPVEAGTKTDTINLKNLPSKIRFYDPKRVDGKEVWDIKYRVYESFNDKVAKWKVISAEKFNKYIGLGDDDTAFYSRKKKSEQGKFVYYLTPQMKDGGEVDYNATETYPEIISWRLGKDLAGKRYYYAFVKGDFFSTEEDNIKVEGDGSSTFIDMGLVFNIDSEHFMDDKSRQAFQKEMIELFPELPRYIVVASTFEQGGEISDEKLDEVFKHYIMASLWSSTDENDEPFDSNYSIDDLDQWNANNVKEQVRKFLVDNAQDLKLSGLSDEQIGHDLWLTQVGHGAGFWDRGLDKELGERLSEASKKLGVSANMYAEDGKVFIDGMNYEYKQGGVLKRLKTYFLGAKPPKYYNYKIVALTNTGKLSVPTETQEEAKEEYEKLIKDSQYHFVTLSKSNVIPNTREFRQESWTTLEYHGGQNEYKDGGSIDSEEFDKILKRMKGSHVKKYDGTEDIWHVDNQKLSQYFQLKRLKLKGDSYKIVITLNAIPVYEKEISDKSPVISNLDTAISHTGQLMEELVKHIVENKEFNFIKFKDGGSFSGWFGRFKRKPKEAQPKEFEVSVVRKDGTKDNPIFPSLWGAESHKKNMESLGHTATIIPLYENGGGIGDGVGDRMYNFLVDDLVKLEKAVSENDKEEIEKFFSYWNIHLKSLAPQNGSDRMYNFLKDDLVKLEEAIKENDKEEIDRFFSYWNTHLKSLKYSKGGVVDSLLIFRYNPSVVKHKSVEKIVGKYTDDWRHDNEDYASFYVNGLTNEQLDNLVRELKNEDVNIIEYSNGGEIEEGDKVTITTSSLGKEYLGMNGEVMPRKLLNGKYSIKLDNGMTMAFSKDEFKHNSINPKYDKGGEVNSKYLDTISPDKKTKILKNIANHYGVSVADAEEEVKYADAEMLYEYIANDQSLRMDVYNDLKNNKYKEGGETSKKKVPVKYIGEDDWHRRLYKSEKGTILVDVDGQLHYITDEGEPLSPAYGFEKVDPIGEPSEAEKFSYMMLSRLQSDVEYYLGYGNRNERHLRSESIDAHIAEMKRIWNSLNVKPEWLSMEEILEYEKNMKSSSDKVDGEITTLYISDARPLSTQLEELTGDSWNTSDFINTNGDTTNLSTLTPFKHIKTGKVFQAIKVEDVASKISSGEMFSKYGLSIINNYADIDEARAHGKKLKESGINYAILKDKDTYYIFSQEKKQSTPEGFTKFLKGGKIEGLNFKLSPSTLNLQLGKYGYDNYASRRVKDWNVDDFNSYAKDMSDSSGNLADPKNTPLLSEIFIKGNFPFNPQGVNDNKYYKEFHTLGGVMYDIWEEIVKQNNLTPKHEDEIIKEPKPVFTKEEQKEVDDYNKLWEETPSEIRWSKGSPITDKMRKRNSELEGKLNLIANHEGKEMIYAKGGGIFSTSEHYHTPSQSIITFDKKTGVVKKIREWGGAPKKEITIDGILYRKNNVYGTYNSVLGNDILSKQTIAKNYTFEQGGSIPNNYEGRRGYDIWQSWTLEQRKHFLDDNDIDNDDFTTEWDGLRDETQDKVSLHVRTGQYSNGGGLEKYKFNVGDTFSSPNKWTKLGKITKIEGDRVYITIGDTEYLKGSHDIKDVIKNFEDGTWVLSTPKNSSLNVSKTHIIVNGNKFYLTKGDVYHFFLSNNPEKKGEAYHIAQIKREPYYDAVSKWLEGTSVIDGMEFKTSMKDGGGVSGDKATEGAKKIISDYIFEYQYPKYKKKPSFNQYYSVDINNVIPVGGMGKDGFVLNFLNGDKSNTVITVDMALEAIKGEIEFEQTEGYWVKIKAIKKNSLEQRGETKSLSDFDRNAFKKLYLENEKANNHLANAKLLVGYWGTPEEKEAVNSYIHKHNMGKDDADEYNATLRLSNKYYKKLFGEDFGINFNITFEKPNSDTAWKETINAETEHEAREKFKLSHPTGKILTIGESFEGGGGIADGYTNIGDVVPSKIEVSETTAYGNPDKLILKYLGKKVGQFYFNMRGYNQDFSLKNSEGVHYGFGGDKPKSKQISDFKNALKSGFIFIKF